MKIAGVHNILWSIILGLFPQLLFDILEIERINYPMIWQSVGMIDGVVDGTIDGIIDGKIVGDMVGFTVGFKLGSVVG